MLQGVAQQDADPPKALARLVNSLRFTRQMELWEDMAAMPDKAAKRRRLAVQLLDDLPNRVAHGDLALADAQRRSGRAPACQTSSSDISPCRSA